MILVNLAVHPLSDEQKEVAREELGVKDFFEFKEIAPSFFSKLINSPDSADEIEKLAKKTMITMVEIMAQPPMLLDIWYFHLPVGSPAFNFVLSSLLYNDEEFKGKILFSHSERVSKEITLPDGSVKKDSVFSFKKFIRF